MTSEKKSNNKNNKALLIGIAAALVAALIALFVYMGRLSSVKHDLKE